MTSNLNHATVLDEPISPKVTEHDKSAAKVARSRASKALSNAKQRCGNPNNPDYATYGAVGIMVLFKNVTELIDDIGPPKPGETLDRINPSAHYEPGNVRWTTKAVQAANKKGSSGNAHLSASAQIAAAKMAIFAKGNRRDTAVGWVRTVTAYNVGHMPNDHAAWMAAKLRCPGIIDANFDFDTVGDWLNTAPGYLHLPALSLPDARVRIRAMPVMTLPAPSHVIRLGRLGGLENLSADWNVPKPIWQRVREQVKGGGAGLVLHGRPTTPQDLLGGWIEGVSLAMASSVSFELKRTAACFPMLRVRRMLADLGSPSGWDEIEHALLDVDVLLIPDFSLDCGKWGDGQGIEWWKVQALLHSRYETGLQTVLGVQNLAKLLMPVREIVLGAYSAVAMPRTESHDCADLQYASVTCGVPPDSTNLRSIREHPGMFRLARRDNSNSS